MFDLKYISEFEARTFCSQTLAFVGDAVHTLYVRQKIVLSKNTPTKDLHSTAVSFVKASGQSKAMRTLLKLFNPNETAVYKRARNFKTNNVSKNASIADYRRATGFEAVIGYLYLSGQLDRLQFILQSIKKRVFMKIEGKNSVIEVLSNQQNLTIEKILINPHMRAADYNKIKALATAKGVPIHNVTDQTLSFESKGRHQGVIAFCGNFKYSSVEDILQVAKEKDESNFIVILDGIEDPHNFGSIIRVCECLGVHGIIIGKNRACPVNDTVIKTSAGASSHMKIAKVTNINQEIQRLKDQNIWVYASELGGEPLETANLKGNIALVIGSEGSGVSAQTKKNCDGIFTIEMKGKVNSLNASVAAGIVVYNASRQR